MMDCLVEAARAAGIQRIHGTYLRTEKNGQVAELFPSLGFVPLPEAGGCSASSAAYELRVESVGSPFSTAIAREGREVSLARK